MSAGPADASADAGRASPLPSPGAVLVMGAGAIGGWLGGRLQLAGADVSYVGRPRVIHRLRQHGLRLSDLSGRDDHLPAHQLDLHERVPANARPALVLLCVKSGATAEAARELGERLAPGTLLLSMQNGIDNTNVARTQAPALTVLAGMVPFNVAELSVGAAPDTQPLHLHRGTEGQLAAQDHPALRAWSALFAAAQLPISLHADLRAVQWGKLLLNLNNAVNALSGLPLLAQLQDRDLRRCSAALIDEALAVLRAAGIAPARMSPLPPGWVPRVMRLPTPLFRIVAARSLRIDAQARSSMADDLARGRPTEVDAIHGAVQGLGARHGVATPLNERISELVRAWPQHPQRWSGAALLQALGAGPGGAAV